MDTTCSCHLRDRSQACELEVIDMIRPDTTNLFTEGTHQGQPAAPKAPPVRLRTCGLLVVDES